MTIICLKVANADILKNLSKAIIRHQKSITMIKSNQKNHHLQYNVSKNRTLVFR